MQIIRNVIGLRIICALFLLAIFAVFLSGCQKNYTYAEAKAYFERNKAQLEELVTLIRDCKYAEQINGDLGENGSGLSTCANHDSRYLSKIVDRLGDLNIQWVVIDWWTPPVNGVARHEFYDANFTLTSHGLLGGGTYSAIVYFSTPMAPSQGMKPLTLPPHHWFYRARTRTQ